MDSSSSWLTHAWTRPGSAVGWQWEEGLRLIECREPRERDVWLHGVLRVAQEMNPYLPVGETLRVWDLMIESPCFGTLHEFQRRWLRLFRAVGARDTVRMAELGALLLATQAELSNDAREYLLMASMTGYLAGRQHQHAGQLWHWYADRIPRAASKPAFRLLRCHAAAGDTQSCADAFAALR